MLQHRIEAAREMLAGTNLPLVEVALSTGFQTQSHFSSVFKRLVEETPARWQRAQRHACEPGIGARPPTPLPPIRRPRAPGSRVRDP